MKFIRICVVKILIASSLSTSAESFGINGLKCTVLDPIEKTVEIGWDGFSTLPIEFEVPYSIDRNGETYKVVNIAANGFKNCSDIVHLIVAGGVGISDNAFCDMSSLETVNILPGITSIGNFVFYNTQNLLNVNIPEGIEEIGEKVFWKTLSLDSITIPYGVKKIGNGAFELSGIKKIELPNSVEEISVCAFSRTKNIKSLVLHQGIKVIGDSAFYGSSIEGLEIPVGVLEIGKSAFESSKIRYLVINDGIKVLRHKALFDVYLEHLELPSSLAKIENEAIGNHRIKDFAPEEFNDREILDLTLPGSISTWSKELCISGQYNALKLCNGICKLPNVGGSRKRWSYRDDGLLFDDIKVGVVKIPETVVELPDEQFAGSEIKSFELPGGLKKIGRYCFWNTTAKEIVIPGSLETISFGAFDGSALEKVVLEEGVRSIERYAFFGCENLKEIYLPSTLTSIDPYAFVYCEGDIYYAGNSSLNTPVVSFHRDCYRSMTLHVSPELEGKIENLSPWNLFRNVIYDYIPNNVIDRESETKAVMRDGLVYYVISEEECTAGVFWDGKEYGEYRSYIIPDEISIDGKIYRVSQIPTCGMTGCHADVLYLPSAYFEVDNNNFVWTPPTEEVSTDVWYYTYKTGNRSSDSYNKNCHRDPYNNSSMWEPDYYQKQVERLYYTDIKQKCDNAFVGIDDVKHDTLQLGHRIIYDLYGNKCCGSVEELCAGIYIIIENGISKKIVKK